jgi:DNA-binding response OmpR family regulator
MGAIGGPSKGTRILIIDDDPDVVRLLKAILQPYGYVIYRACDGKEGLKSAYECHPALIILDVMMPGLDGWDTCARLREMTDVPILMLTACTAEVDMLHGFELGADDYLKKPFTKTELEARVRALLRRHTTQRRISEISHYADSVLNIDLDRQTVDFEGNTVDMSVTEFSLLACLVRNMGTIVPHRQLLREVWGHEDGHTASTLMFYVHSLRKKLKNSQSDHEYLHTQWGRGYCFVPLNEN